MSDAMLLTIGILTTWRITHLFQAEDGPKDLLLGFRKLFGQSLMGELLDCFYCLSIWIAFPIAYALTETWSHSLWLWPTFSAGASLLHKLTSRQLVAPMYYEEEDA